MRFRYRNPEYKLWHFNLHKQHSLNVTTVAIQTTHMVKDNPDFKKTFIGLTIICSNVYNKQMPNIYTG